MDVNTSIGRLLGKVWQELTPSKRNPRISTMLAVKPRFLENKVVMDRTAKIISTTYAFKEVELAELKYLELHPKLIVEEMLNCLHYIFDWCFPDDYRITTLDKKVISFALAKTILKRPINVELEGIRQIRMPMISRPSKVSLKVESVNTADRFKLKIALEEMVTTAIAETRSKLPPEERHEVDFTPEEIIARLIYAGYIDSEGRPHVRKGHLYRKICQIIEGNKRFCEYCGQEIKFWTRTTSKYHSSCRSERSHRLKKMKGREIRLTGDSRPFIIIDVKKGLFVVRTRLSPEKYEVRDRRSSGSKRDLPLIDRYMKIRHKL
jgi:hypothetical protein